MNRLTDAYVAGLIDGEGCISIQKATTGWSHSPRVDVGMTSKALNLLRALEATYGGAVRRTRRATEKWEEAWAWCASGPTAITVLERCLPHLVLKEEQARLALKVDQIKLSLPATASGRRRWNEEAGHRCATLKARVQELNAKGPAPDVAPGWFARLVAGQFLTPQADLLSDLGWSKFSGTLPSSGSMRHGHLYERPLLVQRTGVNDSSSSRMLPTATVSDVYTGNLASSQQKPGSMHSVTLPQAVTRLLPTPRAQNGEDRNSKPWVRPLGQPQNIENALARLPGASSGPPSDGGNGSSDGPLPNLLLTDG